MTFLLTAFRWLGLKGSVLALIALLCASAAGVLYVSSLRLQSRLSASEARVSVLEAQRDAANALAADYESRLASAIAAEQAERAARQAAERARDRKWERIVRDEKAWAEQEVPAQVWEGLGQ